MNNRSREVMISNFISYMFLYINYPLHSISRYNLRKFGELPYHLVRCKQFEDLYSNVLFNYQWLYAKMSACPLQVCYIYLQYVSAVSSLSK